MRTASRRVGEQVGFFITAGDARARDVTIVRERSNVVMVPFPSDAGAVFTFSGARLGLLPSLNAHRTAQHSALVGQYDVIVRCRPPHHLQRFFANLGPGLITGAADDDPSGISTYSVAGASFGYLPLWTALFSFPLMTAVQLMCARLGMVTGLGLAGVIRRRYSRWVLWLRARC